MNVSDWRKSIERKRVIRHERCKEETKHRRGCERVKRIYILPTTSTQVDKPAKPLVEKYTTHLLPSTIKAIKVFAAAHDLKDYEVMQAAISEFLERQKDSDPVIWLSRFALQEKMEVSQVITQALREYREYHT